jgi:hypothetical protein
MTAAFFYWFLKSGKNSGFLSHIFRDELHCITEADISRELNLAELWERLVEQVQMR